MYDDGDVVATSETGKGLYNEFTDYTGLGQGAANYKAYLNLTNPLIIDGNNDSWSNILIPKELQQEMWDYLGERVASTNTRTYAQFAKEKGYGGVIFKGIYDYGEFAKGDLETQTPDRGCYCF